MLKVVLYEHLHELDSLRFVRDDKFPVKVICPNPMLSDIYQNTYCNGNKKIVVDTISRFISHELGSEFGEDFFNRLITKSDLLLTLAVAWKKKWDHLPYQTFYQVFNLFTELRSFTVNSDLISEILNNLDPIKRETISYFWILMEQLNLIDEHQAYYLLSEVYRNPTNSPVYDKNESLVFWGFNFLTALQIDLIKSLALRRDVYIPFPVEVYKNAIASDWIKWLHPAEDVEINTDHNKKVKAIYFSSGKLCETMSMLLKVDQYISADIYLAQKKPSFDQLMEIPINQLFFKVSNDIFLNSFNEISDLIIQLWLDNNQVLSAADLELFLQDQLEQKLKTDNPHQDFKAIKIFLSYKKTLGKWQDLSEMNDNLSLFDIKVIGKYLELGLPRTYYLPLVKNAADFRAFGLESLVGFAEDRKKILCISSDYADLKKDEILYDENIYSFLSTIGPIKRAAFDFSFYKYYMQELLMSKNVVLLIETGLQDRNVAWKEILGKFSLEKISLENNKSKIKKVADYLNDYVKEHVQEKFSISPTGLQIWLDCPRKFYFQIIKKIRDDSIFITQVTPAFLGNLQHVIVQYWCNNSARWSEEDHSAYCEKLLVGELGKARITLTPFDFEQSLNEIITFSRNGILVLKSLQDKFNVIQYVFEKRIHEENDHTIFIGRVDVIGHTENGIFLLDLKRSKSSIPTLGEIRKFDKIQLPYYLAHLPDQEKVLFTGYLCLADITDSMFFAFQNGVLEILVEENLVKAKTADNKNFHYEEWIKNYRQKEVVELKKISIEKKFLAKPRTVKDCEWCAVKNICARGE